MDGTQHDRGSNTNRKSFSEMFLARMGLTGGSGDGAAGYNGDGYKCDR